MHVPPPRRPQERKPFYPPDDPAKDIGPGMLWGLAGLVVFIVVGTLWFGWRPMLL